MPFAKFTEFTLCADGNRDEFQPINESGTLEIVSCSDNQLVLNESDQDGTVQLTLTKQ